MMTEIIILGVCFIGASWQSYQLGIREGAERTVEKLHQKRIIRFDRQGNIKPNNFLDS
jgi:hypothetical protein